MNPVPVGPLVLAAAIACVGSSFAAADAAVTTIHDTRIDVLALTEARFARYRAHQHRVLARWLAGRVSAVGLAAVLLDDALEKTFGVSNPLVPALVTVLLYGVLAAALGAVARQRPEATARLALTWLFPLEWAFAPIAWPLSWLDAFVSTRVTEEHVVDPASAEAELANAVNVGQEAGTIAEEPAEMIRNVLDFQDLTAKDVMVPRRHISAVDIASPLADVLGFVTKDRHSRYPVFRETIDNVVGLLYVKDLFDVLNAGTLSQVTLASLVRRPVLFVTSSQPALTILREMRSRRLHLAVVSDEFGGTAGMVTLEDIIEEIVGEIRDEYDTEAEAALHKLADGRYVASAEIPLSDLEEQLGCVLPTEGAYESLGGLIVHRAGRVPGVGEVLELGGLSLTVVEADATRIVKVEIHLRPPITLKPPAAAPSEGDTSE